MIALKAHFDGKVIVPDEPVELPTNEPLTVHVELTTTNQNQHQEEGSVLKWLVDNAVEDSLPPDLAHQHDHYLYGTPKKEEFKP